MRNPLLTTTFTALVAIGQFVAAAEPIVVGDFRATAQDRIVPEGAKLEVVWNDGDFTEGPVAMRDSTILFTDIGQRIMQFDPGSGKTSVFREPSGKANGLMIDQQGRLIACEGAAGGNRRISITDPDGSVRTLADRWNGKRFNSPNDLAIDRRGRVYFTDPRYVGDEPREIDFEGVFLIDRKGNVKLATRDVQKPNGILVSIDNRHVYLADNNSSDNRHLLRFEVQDDGTLAKKQILFVFNGKQRGIDGMTLDEQGNIYATAGRGDEAGVYVFAPDGKHLAFIATPGDPTNCVFGISNESDGRELRTLYITANGPKVAGKRRRYALYRIVLANAGHRIYP